MRSVARALVVAVAVPIALLGCSDSGKPPTPSAGSGASDRAVTTTTIDVENPPGGRIETARRSSGFKPGQCFTVDGFVAGRTLEPTQLHPIGCDAPHRLEVDAVLLHPDSPAAAFPSSDALAAFADDQCLDQFRGYVGRSYDQSTLDIADIRPTAKSWKAGDRTVVCLVYDQDFADLTSSVEGSAR